MDRVDRADSENLGDSHVVLFNPFLLGSAEWAYASMGDTVEHGGMIESIEGY
jgi:hypothetical protein